MDATEFSNAFRSCANIMPDLTHIPNPVAMAYYNAQAGPKGLEINGFIRVSGNGVNQSMNQIQSLSSDPILKSDYWLVDQHV